MARESVPALPQYLVNIVLKLQYTFTLTLALSHDGRGDKSASIQFVIPVRFDHTMKG